jgi:hypothetical protein
MVKAGADWEILALNDLKEETYATPAILGDKLYIRTREEHSTVSPYRER